MNYWLKDLAARVAASVDRLPQGIKSMLQNTLAAILAAGIVAASAWLTDANLIPDTTPELQKQNELLKQQVSLLEAQNDAFAIPTK